MKQRGNVTLGKKVLMKCFGSSGEMHASKSSLCGLIGESARRRKLYHVVRYLGILCEEVYADFCIHVWSMLCYFVT